MSDDNETTEKTPMSFHVIEDMRIENNRVKFAVSYERNMTVSAKDVEDGKALNAGKRRVTYNLTCDLDVKKALRKIAKHLGTDMDKKPEILNQWDSGTDVIDVLVDDDAFAVSRAGTNVRKKAFDVLAQTIKALEAAGTPTEAIREHAKAEYPEFADLL